MKKLAAAITLILLSPSAIAFFGQETGNGGHAIQCEDQQIVLFDFWEGQKLHKFGEVDLGSPNLTVDEKVEIMLKRLERVMPNHADFLREKYFSEWDKLAVLADPDEEFWVQDFPWADWNPGQIKPFSEIINNNLPERPRGIFTRLPYQTCDFIKLALNSGERYDIFNMATEKEVKILLSKEAYDTLSNDSKAGLIVHELLSYGPNNWGEHFLHLDHGRQEYRRQGARAVTALLASGYADKLSDLDLFYHLLNTELFKVELNGKTGKTAVLSHLDSTKQMDFWKEDWPSKIKEEIEISVDEDAPGFLVTKFVVKSNWSFYGDIFDVVESGLCARSRWLVETAEKVYQKDCSQLNVSHLQRLFEFRGNHTSYQFWDHWFEVNRAPWPKRITVKKGDFAGFTIAGPFEFSPPANTTMKMSLEEGAFSELRFKGRSSFAFSRWTFVKNEDFGMRPFEGMESEETLSLHLNFIKGVSKIPESLFEGTRIKESSNLFMTTWPDLKHFPKSLCQDIELSSLQLSFFELESFSPSFLKRCKGLRDFEMKGFRQLKSLPSAFFKGLNLNNLKIEDHGIETFQKDFFSGIRGLKNLTLEDQWPLEQYTFIEKGLFRPIKPTMQNVDLNFFPLTNFDETFFSGSDQLESLRIRSPQFKTLPDNFCKGCQNLTVFQAVHSEAYNPEQTFNQIEPDAFKGLSNLRHVYLYGNDFPTGLPEELFRNLPKGAEVQLPGDLTDFEGFFSLMLRYRGHIHFRGSY